MAVGILALYNSRENLLHQRITHTPVFKDIQDNSLKSRISTKFGAEIPRTTLSRNPENLRDEVFHSPPTGRPLHGNLDNCSKFTDFRVVITEK